VIRRYSVAGVFRSLDHGDITHGHALDDAVKAAAEKAAALPGMKSLTEYVVGLIEKDAERVIREQEKRDQVSY
jgi:hypothetical protein